MRRAAIIVLASALLFATPATATPADDATAFISSIMDKFNAGDAAAFLAAHQDDAYIVDEFGPHVWSGPGSAKRWMDDFDKDSKLEGVTDARVDYGKPLQATSDGTSAYVVLPTTYRFQQKGMKWSGAGSMTFVVKKAGSGWKIASWTYSGATPLADAPTPATK